jgi:cell division protein FtsI/penicillin-binding protein 2
MPSNNYQRPAIGSANRRLYVWYGVLVFIGLVIILRLFYLQVIKHDYYRKAALSDQLKQ